MVQAFGLETRDQVQSLAPEAIGQPMPHDGGVICVLEVAAIVKGLRQHLDGSHDYTLHCPRAAPTVVACTIIGLSWLGSIVAIVSYLTLAVTRVLGRMHACEQEVSNALAQTSTFVMNHFQLYQQSQLQLMSVMTHDGRVSVEEEVQLDRVAMAQP
ncbi:TPA: hypothetical protein ACH3X1_002341 [Trebouxia sp. C0004]